MTIERIDPVADAAARILSRDGRIRVQSWRAVSVSAYGSSSGGSADETGIAPKLYARVARFEAALRLKASAPDRRWTDIAHALDYHDQMHMVHDFNQLSGDSPTAIGDQLDMFVRPEVRIGR